MKPVDQTKFGEKVGNCMQACLASIFELNIDEVPDFNGPGNSWWYQMQEWLLARNVVPLMVELKDLQTTTIKNEVWCMVGGWSPRGKWGHATVGKWSSKGLELIHDPHPSREFYEKGTHPFDVTFFLAANLLKTDN